jgi:nanoRNase/pAp phosphatase (c-di-AMP/oligoRNAs hydrolase)
MDYTYIIYHAGCPDGFGAAWAAWKKYGDSVKYIPIQPSDPAPELPADAKVLMVDVSLSRSRLLDLRSKVKQVTVVDHHLTNKNDIGDLPDTHFDMNQSGATLAWQFLHPGKKIPELLLYVEDRDLWRFKLQDSREFNASLSSYQRRFDLWEVLSSMGTDKLKHDGGIILRMEARMLEEICENAFWTRIDGHEVPVVNTTTLRSQVGDRLCTLHPTAPFSAYFFEKENAKKERIRCWGLRSPDRFDVSVIAKKYGGGGHANAAGFVELVNKG